MLDDACGLEEIGEMGKKVVSVGGRRVLLLRKGEKVWAVDPKCPHMKFPLSRGKWDGETIKCRFHGACFCADDGSLVNSAWLLGGVGSDRLATYAVTIKDGRVLVDSAEKE